MDSLNISVYHLLFISNLITKSFEGLGKYSSLEIAKTPSNKEMDMILFENVVTIILIRTNSLQDEYCRQFLKIQDERVSDFQNLCEPIWERINQWTEIANFRHNVLAHNLRSDRKDNYKSVFLVRTFNDFDIPKTIKEVMVLVECINIFKQLLYKKFKLEYEFAQQQIVLTKQNSVPTKDIHYEKEINDLLLKLKARA